MVDKRVGSTGNSVLTRRSIVRRAAVGGMAAFGGTLAAPMALRYALAQSAPYKIGTTQCLSGGAAAIGKTALVGIQVAVERINKNGGILGREVKLFVEDDESKPDVGRRKTEKLLVDDKVDAHVGGVLSNICLACMPLYERQKVVNMISVCLDTTITASKCSRFTFRPFDYAPAQAVAFGPYLVNKLGKKWHIVFADYAWGQSTRDAYAEEIKKAGGSVTGSTGIPLNTADMTPFLSKISGDFDGLFIIFFGKDAINIINQGYDLGLPKKYKIAGDGAVAVPSSLPALGNKIDGFTGIDRYIPVLQGALDTPYNKKFHADTLTPLKAVAPDNPLPDRYVQSNFEAMNCLKLGIEKSKFQGRQDSMNLIKALEGLEMKAGDDFPQGDKLLRAEDHQAFVPEFIFEVKASNYTIKEAVPGNKTLVPPACKFPS